MDRILRDKLSRAFGVSLDGEPSFARLRFPIIRNTAVQPRTLTIPAAARYLSCSVKFVRTLIWSRQIKYIKVGRRFVITREELDRWATENQRHA
jgi:excisionase family DNA binding protein